MFGAELINCGFGFLDKLYLLLDLIVEGFERLTSPMRFDLCTADDVGLGDGVCDENRLLLRGMFGGDLNEICSANGRELQLVSETFDFVFVGWKTEAESC